MYVTLVPTSDVAALDDARAFDLLGIAGHFLNFSGISVKKQNTEKHRHIVNFLPHCAQFIVHNRNTCNNFCNVFMNRTLTYLTDEVAYIPAICRCPLGITARYRLVLNAIEVAWFAWIPHRKCR